MLDIANTLTINVMFYTKVLLIFVCDNVNML